jgi:hypothetical protein
LNKFIESFFDFWVRPFPTRHIEQHRGFRKRLLRSKIALRQFRAVKAMCSQEPDGPSGNRQSQAQPFQEALANLDILQGCSKALPWVAVRLSFHNHVASAWPEPQKSRRNSVAENRAGQSATNKSKTEPDETVVALTASNLSTKDSRIHSLESLRDGRYAVAEEMISNDEAKLAVFGAGDAGAIFSDEFPKSRKVKSFGRQKLFYNFLIPCSTHNFAFSFR